FAPSQRADLVRGWVPSFEDSSTAEVLDFSFERHAMLAVRMTRRWFPLQLVCVVGLLAVGALIVPDIAVAQDTATAAAPEAAAAAPAAPAIPTTDEIVPKLWMAADTVWVLVCVMLVFFMNLVYGCVES
ncbi:MAG: hypothetical protein ACKOTB_06445, partial [Planctomycetia bacterium]